MFREWILSRGLQVLSSMKPVNLREISQKNILCQRHSEFSWRYFCGTSNSENFHTSAAARLSKIIIVPLWANVTLYVLVHLRELVRGEAGVGERRVHAYIRDGPIIGPMMYIVLQGANENVAI